ncbi:hypothetical protein HOLleu_31210 [Holothuria leucospilota]|uniref:Uncharacterized protein n=1 Tax=Holothuria leucospilota TaxID=206669 RepID=A0A9Q1BG43_HOLLE|nr:hypothetical protein HOLleu_31210 [Holothuria leucospilota]
MCVSEVVNDYKTKIRAVIDEVAPLLKQFFLGQASCVLGLEHTIYRNVICAG